MRWLRRLFVSALLVLACAGLGFWHAGYRVYIVHTGSMVPTYRPGDVVIDKPVRGRPVPGQVITFRHDADTPDVVTHRVVEVTPAGFVHTKGDANATADVWDIKPDMLRGEVVRGVPRLGYLLVFLRQPTGVAALACALLSLCLLWSVFFAEIEPAADKPTAAQLAQDSSAARSSTPGQPAAEKRTVTRSGSRRAPGRHAADRRPDAALADLFG